MSSSIKVDQNLLKSSPASSSTSLVSSHKHRNENEPGHAYFHIDKSFANKALSSKFSDIQLTYQMSSRFPIGKSFVMTSYNDPLAGPEDWRWLHSFGYRPNQCTVTFANSSEESSASKRRIATPKPCNCLEKEPLDRTVPIEAEFWPYGETRTPWYSFFIGLPMSLEAEISASAKKGSDGSNVQPEVTMTSLSGLVLNKCSPTCSGYQLGCALQRRSGSERLLHRKRPTMTTALIGPPSSAMSDPAETGFISMKVEWDGIQSQQTRETHAPFLGALTIA